ncbi:MAG: VWA domain-containing protein [Ardenticatenaceae bacterium]
MKVKTAPDFLWTLFQQLRRRHFVLGMDDYYALRQSLQVGFGLSSSDRLRDLCCALWAKSKREKEIVAALFDQFDTPTWHLPALESQLDELPPLWQREPDEPAQKEPTTEPERTPTTEGQLQLPPISLDGVELPKHHFVFVPQFPVSYREVAQAWRRLRQPVREGPPTELDIDATITRRCQLGMASEVVLVPRRRNTARLLLLVDRQGSMTPFHGFVEEVCAAIKDSGNLANVAQYYFHDVPAEGADESVLQSLPNNDLFPVLDAVLPDITPLTEGFLYEDTDLLSLQALDKVLDTHANHAAVVLISDAGAARGQYDTLRLLDTIAFLKALRTYTTRYIWLNPLPPKYWSNSTAAQIARHVPMFPLDKAGMYQAVNTLRGQPYLIERPI